MLSDIQRMTGAGPGPLQGSIIWWDLSDSETECQAFQALVKGVGLDPDALPAQPPPARALRDAGQETLKGHGNKKGEYLLRPAGEQGGIFYYALVAENRPLAGTVKHAQSATFAVSPSGALTVTVFDSQAASQAAAVEAAYHRIFGTYQARDIREWITKVVKQCAGVPLRGHGGVYWIPAPFQDVIEKLARVLEGTGKSSLSIVPIHATTLGTAAVAQAARQSLEAAVSECKAELDGWSMDVAHGDGPRPSTVNRRIEDFADLRAKAELYRDILSLQVDDLTTKLSAAEQQARKILLGMEAAK